ncbi:MAG: DUF1707 SHOCT-like domain-containing protein [Solirubrobacteraceae bacterium]
MSDSQAPDSGAPTPAGVGPAASGPPALRASDADRERVIEALGQAAAEGRLNVEELDERLDAVYATRTLAELQALTADVVVATGTAARAPADGISVREGASGGTQRVLSILGGHTHKGHWRLARRCQVVNILGGSELDLTDAELSSHDTEMTVFSVLGGCEIRVPSGLDVQVSKVGILGGNEVKLGTAPPPPGAPVVRIRLISILGGSTVQERLPRVERKVLRGRGS